MTSTTKYFVTSICVAMVMLSIFIGYRYHNYESLEGLRSGISAFKSGDYEGSFSLIEPYAKNNSDAQGLMGKMYAFGFFVEQDSEIALSWFKKASNSDEEIAENLFYVGLDYFESGGLVEIDKAQAKYWFTKAEKYGRSASSKYLHQID